MTLVIALGMVDTVIVMMVYTDDGLLFLSVVLLMVDADDAGDGYFLSV